MTFCEGDAKEHNSVPHQIHTYHLCQKQSEQPLNGEVHSAAYENVHYMDMNFLSFPFYTSRGLGNVWEWIWKVWADLGGAQNGSGYVYCYGWRADILDLVWEYTKFLKVPKFILLDSSCTYEDLAYWKWGGDDWYHLFNVEGIQEAYEVFSCSLQAGKFQN